MQQNQSTPQNQMLTRTPAFSAFAQFGGTGTGGTGGGGVQQPQYQQYGQLQPPRPSATANVHVTHNYYGPCYNVTMRRPGSYDVHLHTPTYGEGFTSTSTPFQQSNPLMASRQNFPSSAMDINLRQELQTGFQTPQANQTSQPLGSSSTNANQRGQGREIVMLIPPFRSTSQRPPNRSSDPTSRPPTNFSLMSSSSGGYPGCSCCCSGCSSRSSRSSCSSNPPQDI